MLDGFQNLFITSINAEQLLGNLVVTLVCGLIISVVYRSIYNGPNYSAKFVQTMVVLAMITALVIMVIGNNLARAFGLVGAMSIIRFRTAVKDTHDIVFIFFSLAVGMAAGVGLRLIALLGTLFIGVMMLGLFKFNYAAPSKREFLLQFNCELPDDKPPYLPILGKFCKKFRLVNMQSLEGNDIYEISFYLVLKNKNNSPLLIKALNKIPAISQIRFFFDEE